MKVFNSYTNIWDYISVNDVFTFIITCRGPGKTYSGLRGLLNIDVPYEFRQFVYMRRTEKILDTVCSKHLNPFDEINADYNRQVCVNGGQIMSFVEGERTLGYAMALSTLHDVRGVTIPKADVIFYDEFIPQTGERTIKQEDSILLHAYDTIARNRELRGNKPTKLICCANPYTSNVPILNTLGLTNIMVDMVRSGKTSTYRDSARGINLTVVYNWEYIQAKSKTALGKLTDGTDFATVAVQGMFDNDRFIKRRALKDYKLISAINALEVWEHKSNTLDTYIIYNPKRTKCIDSPQYIADNYKLLEVPARMDMLTFADAMTQNECFKIYPSIQKIMFRR